MNPILRKYLHHRIIYIAIGIVATFWGGLLIIAIYSASVKDGVEKLGSIADSFGIFSSVVTGLALVAATISALVQADQLQNERDKTRNERKLDNLDKIAFAFRGVGQTMQSILEQKAQFMFKQEDPLAFLRETHVEKSTAEQIEDQKIKGQLLNSQSEIEILVSAYCDELGEELKAVQDAIREFSANFPNEGRHEVFKRVMKVIHASEAGVRATVAALSDLNKKIHQD